ncbi:MFS transporter [Salininema proteolyticum]|uniref:MFS transporter n=1 Tax=Salininema proteolyticum TaxID=1607685 RepID=A0ABV8U5A0_9ACTN
MYISTTARSSNSRLGFVSGNVLALGSVSLVTDVSAEMVTSVLPLYLVVGLGLSPLQFGLVDGVYNGVTALVRVAGGHAADRKQKYKLVAGTGYGLSACSKLGLLAAGSSIPLLAGVIAADRVGKGIRTAPRDALISLSAPPHRLGAAFGTHRAMDVCGALLGPLIAFAVLWNTGNSFDAVFVTSFCFAAFGVILLTLFVSNRREPSRRQKPSLRLALRTPGAGRLCAVAGLLALVAIGDNFLYLIMARRADLAAEYYPLLPLGTAAAYLLLAVPLGHLADRVGRWRLFLAGHAVLLAAYGLLALTSDHLLLLIAVPLILGVSYAATDGVLMALAGPVFPESVRGSGIALVQSSQALARMAGSVLFGSMWLWWGETPAVLASAALLATALALVARKTKNRRTS